MAAISRVQLTTALLGGSAVAVCYALILRRRRALQAIVTQLTVYPVKSCRGISLETAELDAGGIRHDREWMIVRAPEIGSNNLSAEMLTIRDHPRMASIQPSFTAQGKLMLSTDDGKSIVVENDSVTQYTSIVWRTEVTGSDQGDVVAKFLTSFLDCLDKPVRLVRMDAASRRLIDCHKYNSTVASHDDKGGSSRFSDWTQFSIVSNQSISWLNALQTIGGGMTNARFRMNIVVDAAEAFAEDGWDMFSVGDVEFQFLKRCGRCLVPTIDPSTGIRRADLEPLKTLKRLRRGDYPFLEPGSDVQAFLGVNCRHFHRPGQIIRVGDRVLARRRNGSWLLG